MILELSNGETRTLPGPIRTITVQSGSVIVVDPTTQPNTTILLGPDETFDGAGKANLRILDAGDGGARLYYESSLEGENRTEPLVVTGPDTRPVTDVHGEPIDTAESVPVSDTPTDPPANNLLSDDDTGTGKFEDRTVAELKATAKKNGVELHGASKKSDIIEKLRG